MNYYPFYNFSGVPYNTIANKGLFSRIFSNINFSSILNGTQKTITFMNQAIPMVKQISPLVKNTKTMFKVMNEFKKSDSKKTNVSITKPESIEKVVPNTSTTSNNNSPTFFL